MSKFTDAIDFVRHAYRAKDVRNAIADSMEEVWSHVTSEKEAAAKSASDALTYKNDANTSKTAAATSATNALRSEQNAQSSANASEASKNSAATSASNASKSEQNAQSSANAAAESATKAAARAFNYVGFYTSESALKSAQATSSDGYWAIVGATDSIWVWDSDTQTWKDSHDMSRLSDYMAEASFNPNGHAPEQVAFASDIEKLMPIGYIYQWSPRTGGPDLSTAEKLKAYLGFGTWEAVASGRVLEGCDSSHAAGTTVNAGLPNITGELGISIATSASDTSALPTVTSGAFAGSTTTGSRPYFRSDGTTSSTIKYHWNSSFDASRSSSVYGKSTTVQPSAMFVYIYQRIA